ncbi:hypothetical protein [Advenella sp. FME57]|uniref:hypothetical protein n=1 Tax=Advenella sp. FME57 TaxID=2742604 RepID=UPI001865BF38|nr:hypothetical protein [Advenella sp. FME57]
MVLAILSAGTIVILKHWGQVPIYESSGLIEKILGFVQVLPGFYIAALAAIATFNKLDIDKTMPAPAPKIDVIVNGTSVPIELTRRRFLCSMFAFLTAESFILIVLAIFALIAHSPIKGLLPDNVHFASSMGFLFAFMLLFWQMVLATFWGLFYLGDRLHQPDAKA